MSRSGGVGGAGGRVGGGDGVGWEPYRLIGPRAPVGAVAAFFGDLQAAGRSEATLRSYGMDLLRWFRFLWAIDVTWDRATQVEAREFCRWLLVAGKPVRVHWRRARRCPPGQQFEAGLLGVGSSAQRDGAARLLRIPPRRGHRPGAEPVPAGPLAARRARRMRITTRWSRTATSGPGCIGRRVPSADPAQRDRRRSSTRSSPGCPRIATGRWSRSMCPPGRGPRSCCR